MLGFSGDPHSFITTADLAARMGYAGAESFRNALARDLKRRGFPPPVRRGVWRLGDLQKWSEEAPARSAASANARPRQCAEPTRGCVEDTSNLPRAAVLHRLHLVVNTR